MFNPDDCIGGGTIQMLTLLDQLVYSPQRESGYLLESDEAMVYDDDGTPESDAISYSLENKDIPEWARKRLIPRR